MVDPLTQPTATETGAQNSNGLLKDWIEAQYPPKKKKEKPSVDLHSVDGFYLPTIYCKSNGISLDIRHFLIVLFQYKSIVISFKITKFLLIIINY